MIRKKIEILVAGKMVADFILTDYKKVSEFHIYNDEIAKSVLKQMSVKQSEETFTKLLRYYMDKMDSLEECMNHIERYGFASVHNPELEVKVIDKTRFLRGEVFDFYDIHEGSEIYLNPKVKCKTRDVLLLWENDGCARVTNKLRYIREQTNGSRFCEAVFPKKNRRLGDIWERLGIDNTILVPNIQTTPIRYEISICKNGEISWGCDKDRLGQNRFWMEVRYYNDLLTVDSKQVNKIIYAWTEQDSHTKVIADWFETSFCRKQTFSWEKLGQELTAIGIDIHYPNLRIWFKEGTYVDSNLIEWAD